MTPSTIINIAVSFSLILLSAFLFIYTNLTLLAMTCLFLAAAVILSQWLSRNTQPIVNHIDHFTNIDRLNHSRVNLSKHGIKDALLGANVINDGFHQRDNLSIVKWKKTKSQETSSVESPVRSFGAELEALEKAINSDASVTPGMLKPEHNRAVELLRCLTTEHYTTLLSRRIMLGRHSIDWQQECDRLIENEWQPEFSQPFPLSRTQCYQVIDSYLDVLFDQECDNDAINDELNLFEKSIQAA